MSFGVGVWVVWVGSFASVALGVGCGFLLHAVVGTRWAWLLTPAFVALWLSLGFGALVSLDGLVGRP